MATTTPVTRAIDLCRGEDGRLSDSLSAQAWEFWAHYTTVAPTREHANRVMLALEAAWAEQNASDAREMEGQA